MDFILVWLSKTLQNQLDNSFAISSTNFTLSGDQEISNKTAFQ